MSVAIHRKGYQEQPLIRLNKSLSLACDELERIADSLRNDKRIRTTAKGVNAINREFESNIDLHEIRKLKFDDFKDKFDRNIHPSSVANDLEFLAKIVRSGSYIYDHIGGLADVERALKITLISHLYNKTSLVKYMRKNKLKFKDGYSLDKPHKLYWGKRDQYEMHFFFPFQYRPMTASEIEREAKQAAKVKKAAVKKAQVTKKKNAVIEKKRLRSAALIVQNIANSVDNYLFNSDPNTPLFLDTETTGLSAKDEVIEIAIIDLNNTVIIDTFIYTKRRIDDDACYVHNIRKLDIDNMPKFSEIEDHISRLLDGRQLYIFNAKFDVYKMQKSASDDFKIKASSIDCLMSLASSKLSSYYRISLADACDRVGVECGGHRAASDTLASIRLYKALTAKSEGIDLA